MRDHSTYTRDVSQLFGLSLTFEIGPKGVKEYKPRSIVRKYISLHQSIYLCINLRNPNITLH